MTTQIRLPPLENVSDIPKMIQIIEKTDLDKNTKRKLVEWLEITELDWSSVGGLLKIFQSKRDDIQQEYNTVLELSPEKKALVDTYMGKYKSETSETVKQVIDDMNEAGDVDNASVLHFVYLSKQLKFLTIYYEFFEAIQDGKLKNFKFNWSRMIDAVNGCLDRNIDISDLF
ncbi:unnamed protein product [Ambrosiozyma monospora]|uniref:Unnamed protein product n=1 Tax=Ambrosiozyma monospora TaxID=43982 RepID=A0ACB5STU6_AMBMO|nr:unnamed protein product [Ambrosiozyma monospora]